MIEQTFQVIKQNARNLLAIKQAATLRGALTRIEQVKDENAFQWNHGRNIFATVVFSPKKWVSPQCLFPTVRANKSSRMLR